MDIKIEFSLKKQQADMEVPPWFDTLTQPFKTYESDMRYIFVVGSDWNGFRNGTVRRMLSYFGDSLYCALVCVSSDPNVIITDFEGRMVDNFPVFEEGRHGLRYVKRRLRIKSPVEGISGLYSITDYIINPMIESPVVKTLDIYSFEKTDTGCMEKLKR